MERRADISRIQKGAADGARLFVKDIRSKLKKGAEALFGFKTWKAFQDAVAKARLNDYRRRYGRTCYNTPHIGDQQIARTQRIGSPAWHGWQNWRRQQ